MEKRKEKKNMNKKLYEINRNNKKNNWSIQEKKKANLMKNY